MHISLVKYILVISFAFLFNCDFLVSDAKAVRHPISRTKRKPIARRGAISKKKTQAASTATPTSKGAVNKPKRRIKRRGRKQVQEETISTPADEAISKPKRRSRRRNRKAAQDEQSNPIESVEENSPTASDEEASNLRKQNRAKVVRSAVKGGLNLLTPLVSKIKIPGSKATSDSDAESEVQKSEEAKLDESNHSSTENSSSESSETQNPVIQSTGDINPRADTPASSESRETSIAQENNDSSTTSEPSPSENYSISRATADPPREVYEEPFVKSTMGEPREASRPSVERLCSKTTSGILYLGSGYDITKGNPLGSPTTLVDPGYKDPVILQTCHESIWIRRLATCSKQGHTLDSSTHRESKASNELKTDISANISIGGSKEGEGEASEKISIKFAAAFYHNSLMGMLMAKGDKIHQSNIYCYSYAAGYTSSPSNLELSSGFEGAIDSLAKSGLEKCTPLLFREDPNYSECSGMRTWLSLFKTFGTHFVSNVFLGGKIVLSEAINDSMNDNVNQKAVDASVSLKVSSGVDLAAGAKISREDASLHKSLVESRTLQSLGGNLLYPIEGLAEWADSLPFTAMPLRASVKPISILIPELTDQYDLALSLYTNVTN